MADEKEEGRPAAPMALRLFGAKAQDIVREMDRLQDKVQALAAEVDEPRASAVLSLSHDLLDLQHRAKLLVQLLSI